MAKINPFDECPIYETKHFTFKLVNEEDADDLFICYTDKITLEHMNNDNCSGTWQLKSSEDMKYAWQSDYKNRWFVRWSIHLKEENKVVGTIEIAPLPWKRWFFGKDKPIGILRIDLLSKYESKEYFSEILKLMSTTLASDFEVDQVIFKAPQNQKEKREATIECGFTPYTYKEFDYFDYYTFYVKKYEE